MNLHLKCYMWHHLKELMTLVFNYRRPRCPIIIRGFLLKLTGEPVNGSYLNDIDVSVGSRVRLSPAV